MIVCSSIALLAYSYSYDYVISGVTGWKAGGDVFLDSTIKDYMNIHVSCSNSGAEASLALWKKGGLFEKDKWYGDDQVVTVGYGRSAWWYGGPSGYYHIDATVVRNNQSPVNLDGTFRSR